MWYSAGTVAVTANSATVTGTGTAFSANARVGDAFRGPDGRWYEVTNIASATVLSISPPYVGESVSAGSYSIAPMQGYVKESADRLRKVVDEFGAILSELGAYGPTIKIDATGVLADRSQYDSAGAGFAFYASDSEQLYLKLSSTLGDWSAGAPVARGPAGEKGDTGDVTPEAIAARDTAQAAAESAEDSAQAAAASAAAVAAIGAGWTPVIALVPDGERIVMQVADWTGGEANKPTVGQYVGPSGFVTDIAQATDVRGAAGAGSGAVESVSGVLPDANGNVQLNAADVGALPESGTAADSSMLGGKPASHYAPLAELITASPSILIADQLRRSVEVATGGRQTVLYTAKGQPSHMYVLPRFSCEDVAPGGELGTGTHPAFLFNGTPAQEIFVGAHLASEVAGEAVSRPFADPRTSINFDQSRALCQANGPGWDLMSNLDWAAIALWCMANGYEPLGNTNWGRHHTKRWETGRRVDTLPPGEVAGTGRTLTGSGPASWAHDGTPAGIQDLVGNVWEWVSGMKMVNGRAWLAPDNGRLTESQFVDSGFDMPTTRVFSSVSAAGASALVKQSLIAPASASLAPQGTLYTDLTAERLPLRGGTWNGSSTAGLGALYLYDARTNAYSTIGFRPRFRAL